MVWNITWRSDTKRRECFFFLLIGSLTDCFPHLLLIHLFLSRQASAVRSWNTRQKYTSNTRQTTTSNTKHALKGKGEETQTELLRVFKFYSISNTFCKIDIYMKYKTCFKKNDFNRPRRWKLEIVLPDLDFFLKPHFRKGHFVKKERKGDFVLLIRISGYFVKGLKLFRKEVKAKKRVY